MMALNIFRVDADQFFRLIFNLLDNANKAGASSISITVWRTGRSTVIDIADNGPGLDDKARATLFKPFEGGRTWRHRVRAFYRPGHCLCP